MKKRMKEQEEKEVGRKMSRMQDKQTSIRSAGMHSKCAASTVDCDSVISYYVAGQTIK